MEALIEKPQRPALSATKKTAVERAASGASSGSGADASAAGVSTEAAPATAP
jgi:hypothetical protein